MDDDFIINESLTVYDRVVYMGDKGNPEYVQIVLAQELREEGDELTLTTEAAKELQKLLNMWFEAQQ